MPAHQFLNPYAALTDPNVAAGGFATLAGALASAPQEQAEIAMRGRQLQSRDMFERARLAQEDKRLSDEAEYRRGSLEESRRYHGDEMDWRRSTDAERQRHDQATEAKAAAGATAGGGNSWLGSIADGFGIPGLGGFGGGAPAAKTPAHATHDPGLDAATVMAHAYSAAKAAHPDGDPTAIEQTANELYDRAASTPGSNLPPRPQPKGRTVLPPGGKPYGSDVPTVSASPLSLRPSGQPGVHSLGDVLSGRWFGQGDFASDQMQQSGQGAPPAAATPAAPATKGTLKTSAMIQNIGPGKPFADLQSAIADAQGRGYTVVQDQ